jgi:hypothetical protein
LTDQPESKRYKVSVVDRETGSVRPSRATASEDTAPEPDPADGEVSGDPETGDATATPGTPAKAAAAKPKVASPAKPSAAGRRRWPPRALGGKGQVVLAGIAVLGIVGTAVFGHAWASLNGQQSQAAQVRSVTNDFLLALTNFDAKNVDADFNKIQQYATGSFASQSNQFFGSTIRSQLEAALASSRGQIRSQFVQSISGNKASVYSVVDQTYINNKMTSPSADELQIQTDLTMTGSGWKVSNVTVLNNSGASGTGSSSSSTPTTTVPPTATTPSSTAAP